MALSGRSKIAIATILVVVVAITAYTLFPYAVSTKISDLKNNQVVYVYGTVENRNALGNNSIFAVNDTSGTVYVLWNGTLPANGDKVLVHGTYEQITILFISYGVIRASSVTPWAF